MVCKPLLQTLLRDIWMLLFTTWLQLKTSKPNP
jgi:hypothetical protein